MLSLDINLYRIITCKLNKQYNVKFPDGNDSTSGTTNENAEKFIDCLAVANNKLQLSFVLHFNNQTKVLFLTMKVMKCYMNSFNYLYKLNKWHGICFIVFFRRVNYPYPIIRAKLYPELVNIISKLFFSLPQYLKLWLDSPQVWLR